VAGDPAPARSCADWYRSEHAAVLALVFVLCGSRWAAEELTQDAFVEAHRRWASVSSYENPGAWVRRVAINKTRSWGRRRSAEGRAYVKHMARRREVPEEMPESADAFWAAVRRLPEQQAQVIALHYVEDRPVDDIASILGVPAGTVKSQLHRARKALATTLALEIEEDER
jgi:RNA polymerase sigma-70 factor, ECF subfamily